MQLVLGGKTFLYYLQEFFADIGFDIGTIWGVKPSDVSFPLSFGIGAVAVGFWRGFKFQLVVVSTFI